MDWCLLVQEFCNARAWLDPILATLLLLVVTATVNTGIFTIASSHCDCQYWQLYYC